MQPFLQPVLVHAPAWVIWAAHNVWSREGYMPGPVADMHSGLAEAYGICTVLSFFHQYIHLFPLTLEISQSIQVYCDNKGVIEQTNHPNTPMHPQDTLWDDFLIFAAIQCNLQQLHVSSFTMSMVTRTNIIIAHLP